MISRLPGLRMISTSCSSRRVPQLSGSGPWGSQNVPASHGPASGFGAPPEPASLIDITGALRLPLLEAGCFDETVSAISTYCTPGTSASGCQASISAAGTPSATAALGFILSASSVEGLKNGQFFFGTNGRQANPWGTGTSYQCVVPPVVRAGLLIGVGVVGLCNGSFAQDLNAVWTTKPAKNPGAGALVQAQFWYRDPFSTSNQPTSLSDAIEFVVAP